MYLNRIFGFYVGSDIWKKGFSTMSLDEQNEKANEAITTQLTQLNAALETAELKLREMKLPREIWHTCNVVRVDEEYDISDFEQIGMKKINGEWCLCYAIGRQDDGPPEISSKPYRECSIAERLLVANNLNGLKKEIVKAKEEYVGDIISALDNIVTFMRD
jgi:hypothetical protein